VSVVEVVRTGERMKIGRESEVRLWLLAAMCALALLDAGAGKERQEEDIPIVQAACEGDAKAAKTLISAGADVNVKTGENGWTALLYACEKGADEVVDLLLRAGADVNYQGPWRKYTPLMLAVESGNTNTVSLLLKAGADPNLKDMYGSTALLRARAAGRSAMEEALLRHGAKEIEAVCTLEELRLSDADALRYELCDLTSSHRKWMAKNYKLYTSGYRPTWTDIKPYVNKSLPVYMRDGKDPLGSKIVFNAFRSGHLPVTLSPESAMSFEKILGAGKASEAFWGEYYPRESR
jgi:hypothetical protein